VSEWTICFLAICITVVLLAVSATADNIAYLRWGRWLADHHGLSGLAQGRQFMDVRPDLFSLLVRLKVDWRYLLGNRGD
jgi:hypothetical protein